MSAARHLAGALARLALRAADSAEAERLPQPDAIGLALVELCRASNFMSRTDLDAAASGFAHVFIAGFQKSEGSK